MEYRNPITALGRPAIEVAPLWTQGSKQARPARNWLRRAAAVADGSGAVQTVELGDVTGAFVY